MRETTSQGVPASALSGVLRDEGYTVDAVESGEQCLDRVVREVFDVIVLDVWLPGSTASRRSAACGR